MDRLFSSLGNHRDRSSETFLDDYEARIKAMIDDAADYNMSNLSPRRETNMEYYNGTLPALEDDGGEPVLGDPNVQDPVNRSTAVSTDVKDTVMAILPSLMRIFTSSDDVVDFIPSRPELDEGAKQAKIDVLYTFNEENPGFLILHNTFKDAMTTDVGIVKWWSDDSTTVKREEFRNIEVEELQNLMMEYEQGNSSGEKRVEVLEMTQPDENGIIERVELEYREIKPTRIVRCVPPEDFRIDRRAESTETAALIGTECIVPCSDVIKMGYDKELVYQYRGQYDYWAVEKSIRDEGIDTSIINEDLVVYGEYFIRIDQDGDGIDELHRIRTLGDNYDIIEDVIVDDHNLAVFSGDPTPHRVVGSCVAELVKDIQNIKTQMLRGALDSLSGSMFADLAVNETLVNMEDVLSDGVGRVIRTKTDPSIAMKEFRSSFVGAEVFEMMGVMDTIRQSRTGISEASKGVDPKALQSTNLMGIDAIVTGAQERIELIARIFAETGFKRLMQGLFKEVVRNPNRNRTIHVQGKWVTLNPSLYDPNMTVRVNPSLGKGSDMTKMLALQQVQETQMMIITQMGLTNPFVTPEQILNTIKDRLAIANIKNTTRYFNDITPEIMASIQGPKEPTPEEIIARASLEEVKAKTAKIISDRTLQERKLVLEDDFKRDQLGLQTLVQLVTSLAEHPTASAQVPEAEAIIDQRNQPPA